MDVSFIHPFGFFKLFSLNMCKLGYILILKLKYLALVSLVGIYSPCSLMANKQGKGGRCIGYANSGKQNKY